MEGTIHVEIGKIVWGRQGLSVSTARMMPCWHALTLGEWDAMRRGGTSRTETLPEALLAVWTDSVVGRPIASSVVEIVRLQQRVGLDESVLAMTPAYCICKSSAVCCVMWLKDWLRCALFWPAWNKQALGPSCLSVLLRSPRPNYG